MDIGPGFGTFAHPVETSDAQELWAEHGWALNGWQAGGVVAAIVLASVLVKLVGGLLG